ncbi:MAG: hypothetical protein WAS90_12705 [Brachymonas denitrificans]
MAALELHQYRAMFYRLTLDSIEWNEERHPRDKRGKFQKRDAITSPDVAADAMRRAILTQQDVRHAVYRADIGYVDFIWGTEGGPPSAAGKRKGAMGIAHILDARVRKDGLTPRQAERVAEQVARVVATGKMKPPVQVLGITNAQITDGRHTAVLVKEPGADAWLLTGWENK